MTSSIAAIHVAKKQLGLDEDTYRAKLRLIVGKDSTKAMSEQERQRVLEVFRNEGFKPALKPRPDGRKKLTGKYAKKMQALWIAGWNLGVVRDRDDAALRKFICGRVPIDAAEWLRFADDAERCIEPLKIMLARDGGVDWSKSRFMSLHTQTDGYRIAAAQWRRLGNHGDLMAFARRHVSKDMTVALDDRDWIAVMNELGQQVRAKAGA